MKYHRLIENAERPKGFWGKLMINSMNKGHNELTDWALEHINIERNNYVLDAGCGGGRTVSKLSQLVGNGKVFGIDYSELCVKKSIKLNKKHILCGKTKILQADIAELPFEDETFNIITAIETYYFWKNKPECLAEIKRVLKNNGKVMLVFEMLRTEDEPNKWEKVEQTINIKSVSEEEIREILKQCGYSNIQTFIKADKNWLCAIAEKTTEA